MNEGRLRLNDDNDNRCEFMPDCYKRLLPLAQSFFQKGQPYDVLNLNRRQGINRNAPTGDYDFTYCFIRKFLQIHLKYISFYGTVLS